MSQSHQFPQEADTDNRYSLCISRGYLIKGTLDIQPYFILFMGKASRSFG